MHLLFNVINYLGGKYTYIRFGRPSAHGNETLYCKSSFLTVFFRVKS